MATPKTKKPRTQTVASRIAQGLRELFKDCPDLKEVVVRARSGGEVWLTFPREWGAWRISVSVHALRKFELYYTPTVLKTRANVWWDYDASQVSVDLGYLRNALPALRDKVSRLEEIEQSLRALGGL